MKTTIEIFSSKKNKSKISMITCYDYSTAVILNKTEIDSILVGDTLGMVFQGNDSTLPVTMDEMIYHTKAVRKGAPDKFLILDMPFLTYHINVEDAVRNAGRALKEAHAEAVKVEGGEEMIDKIKAMISAKIPVMGHIGLTPQSINLFGGYKVQGKSVDDAKKLINNALVLEEAGVFAIVLEGIPEKLAEIITKKLTIPTIGIGAGRYVDGQIIVINDILGIYEDFVPKFVKKYANLGADIKKGIETYIKEVNDGIYPAEEHVYKINKEILDIIKKV
ncbi:MAG: 3-methyl-2-oxobutanoate hydroxymethyltransferase [Spirochaetes bacterium]|nr:3-methyl-2-oxobutanoate hydroxymethyltransferase [Spirochaetota bacterium]